MTAETRYMHTKNPLLLRGGNGWRRNLKRGVFFAALLAVVLWLSYEFEFFLRSDCRWIFPGLPEGVPENIRSRIPLVALCVVPLQLAALYFSGWFRSVFAYFRIPELARIGVAMTICFAVMFFGARFVLLRLDVINSGVHASALVINYFLALFSVCAVRVVARLLWERKKDPGDAPEEAQRTRVAIFGAGDAGSSLATTLKARPGFGKKPMFFIDDDPEKNGMLVVGLPVFSTPDDLSALRDGYGVTELILAASVGYGSVDYTGYYAGYYYGRLDAEVELLSFDLETGLNLSLNAGERFSLFFGPRVGLNLLYVSETVETSWTRIKDDETEAGLLYGGDVGFTIKFTDHSGLTASVGYRASTAQPLEIEEQSWVRFSVGYKHTF